MSTNTPTTFYIVRHGQSKWNQNPESADADSEMTELGINQIREVLTKFKSIDFSAVFSSPLKRAVQTAEIFINGRNMKVMIDERLRERDFGSFYKNKTTEEVKSLIKKLYKKIDTFPETDLWNYKIIDDMESEGEAVHRFMEFLKQTATSFEGKNVFIVGHGNLMRSFLVQLKYGTLKELKPGSLSNAGYIKVKCDGKSFSLEEVVGVKKFES